MYKQFVMRFTLMSMTLYSAPAFAQHDGDVFVGRSSAGQLKIGGFIPDDNIVLLPAVSGLFNGWSDNNPGFDRVVTADPVIDLNPLQSGVQVRLEVVQVDPAFQAITSSLQIIENPGQRALLGGSNLHAHLTWLVNSGHALFDPLKVLWRATFKLVDTGSTGYTESAPFTFYFAIVDCIRGDTNEDGEINAMDIAAFIDTVLDPSSKSPADRCRADVNLDGYATIDDVVEFVEMLLSQ